MRAWVRPDLIYGCDWSGLIAFASLGVPLIYEVH
jgi:hypothetical protein